MCEKCVILAEKKEAIDFLNDQIHDLTATIEKLCNIRAIEDEIEQSFISMAPNFQHQEHRDTKLSSSDLSTDDQHEANPNTNHDNNGETHNIEHEIDSISQQFSQLNVRVPDVVLASNEQENNLSPDEPDLPTEDLQLE